MIFRTSSIDNASCRICLGQQRALIQMGYVTIRVLQHFDALDGSAHVGEPILWDLRLTGRPFNGVNVRLHKAEM